LDSRSSTSSSDAPRARLPWGGIVAAALVVALELVTFGPLAEPLFESFAAQDLTRWRVLERGLVRDEVERLELARTDDDRARVLVIGSSRAWRGVTPDVLDPSELDGLAVARLAHAQIAPLEAYALADRACGERVDAVVLPLSEFDTHRPLKLVPQAFDGSFRALFGFVRETGPGFALEHREPLLRMTLNGLLPSYRYRTVLAEGGLDRLRRFPSTRRFVPGRLELWRPVLGEEPEDIADTPGVRALIQDALGKPYERLGAALRSQLVQAASVSRGEHVRVQEALIEDTVRRLRACGIQVVVIELPLHPVSLAMFDGALRDEFLAFARDLNAPGVRFVPLEELRPFGAADFKDLTHLDDRGGAITTRAALAAVRELLAER
jgi:hypothetical protein